RLYRSLVNSGAALQANASLDSRVGPGLLSGFILANQGVSPDSLLGLFRAEVARLHSDPPTEAELEKARNSVEADLIEGRQRVLSKAETLQDYAFFRPDISQVNSDLGRFEAVTVDDLRRVADRYLNQDNLTVIIDLPQGAAGAPGAGSGPAPAADSSGGGGGSGGGPGGAKGGAR
ncbi:MAG TPA: hypothetical protein VKA44_03425, partial [Gemmatimonadota bacterium]|nr:hypothetical protein [Gemmatimonadota bacterium]